MFNTSYKTIYVDGYDDYLTDHVSLKPLKGVNGEIDFLDVNSFKDIDADELKIYVDLEQEFLYKRIEDVMGEQGKYTEHAGNEMTRLFGGKMKSRDFDGNLVAASSDTDGEIINAYTDYEAGQAKKNGNAFNKPLFDGGPSARVVTQVAGTIVLTACGQPWAAWALNSAFSAMDVANGDLEMKHALVQMGVSAVAGGATSALGSYAGQAVNMAASGIDYEAGGSIGWSGDNFKAGIKRGMVNMAISATGNSFNKGMNGTGYERVGAGLNSGVSSFVNSGLDVDNGSWWRIGWKEEGTMDHVMAGIASATASAATYSKTGQNPSKNTKGETTYDKYNYDGDFSQEGYNSKLLYNTINSGMMSLYNMAKHDLSWEDASKQNGFYSGMLYDHKDIAGRLGKFVASGFDPDFDRKKPASQGSENDNPDRDAESLVGALWQGLKQIGDDFTGAMESISNGLGGHGFRSDREIQMANLRASQIEYIMHEGSSITEDFNKDVKSVTESRKKNLYANIEAAGLTDQFSGMMDNLDSQIMTMRRADQIAKAMKREQEQKRLMVGNAYGLSDELYASTVNSKIEGDFKYDNSPQINLAGFSMDGFIDSVKYAGELVGDAYDYVKKNPKTLLYTLPGINEQTVDQASKNLVNFKNDIGKYLGENLAGEHKYYLQVSSQIQLGVTFPTYFAPIQSPLNLLGYKFNDYFNLETKESRQKYYDLALKNKSTFETISLDSISNNWTDFHEFTVNINKDNFFDSDFISYKKYSMGSKTKSSGSAIWHHNTKNANFGELEFQDNGKIGLGVDVPALSIGWGEFKGIEEAVSSFLGKSRSLDILAGSITNLAGIKKKFLQDFTFSQSITDGNKWNEVDFSKLFSLTYGVSETIQRDKLKLEMDSTQFENKSGKFYEEYAKDVNRGKKYLKGYDELSFWEKLKKTARYIFKK